MCGIAGIWSFDNNCVSKENIQRFTDSLIHRGPDNGSYWIHSDGSLGLGHRRLSILDLSPAGNQPMPYLGERYRITYNGEVFNFLELKKELENKGYFFSTSTDTEVILAAYDCWGAECLNKFNGMWAFAIWDELHQKLFLARDRFGIKPLYYHCQPKKLFAFASETFAFKFLDGYKREFNHQNLSHNIVNPFVLEAQGHTIYEEVYQLLPGHYMEATNSSAPKQKRWWNTLSAIYRIDGGYDRQVEQFKELFLDAIKLQLRSDVSIASALSGGLDSTSVYCGIHHVMKKASKQERIPANWQQAFVATFPGTSMDERCYAEQVVEYTKGKAHYIEPDFSNLAQQIKDTTILFDNIYLSPILPACEIYRTMKLEDIKVSMDGHGVDEMLFGYPGMLENVMKARYNGSLRPGNEMLEIVLDMESQDDRETTLKRLTTRSRSAGLRTVKNIVKKIAPESLKRFLTKQGISGNTFGIYAGQALRPLNAEPSATEALSIEDRVTYETFHANTLQTILRNFDHISMQNSVEIRMPFLDHRLVSFVFSLPFESKVGNGYTKRIVRDAMKGIIPESTRTRKWKVGFNAPMEQWFSEHLSEFIMDEINSASFINAGIWNGKAVRDFAGKKIKNGSWTFEDCIYFWPVFNAHLLISNNKS